MITDFIYYDLKVAALIAVFYLFYQLLLAREAMPSLNRTVLLTAIALSLVLPLCVVTIHVSAPLAPIADRGGFTTPMDLVAPPSATQKPTATTPLGAELWGSILGTILAAGILIRLSVVARSCWQLHRLIANGERHILPSGTQVCVVESPVAPFSWMHTVVLSRAEWLSLSPYVLAHEEAHVRHRHSYDVLVVEVLTALQWFNPVVWFLRQELRTLHEYEADASVLSRGFDESQYIHLLMQKATGIQACALANGIHTPKTKKRILMMLKTKSNRGAWLKALYIVPVVLTSLAMTAKTVVDDETVTTDDNRAVRIFNEKTNDRGDSYQIRHQPGVKFFRNGQEEPIPEGRSIALEVKKTTMQVNGKPIDQLSLLDLPLGALKEIHLTETGSDRYVCNLLTEKTIAYSANMSDMEFVIHVKQQQAAGIKQGDVTQSMLNEDGSISRARILHMNSAYGSKKGYLYVVDGKEVSREDYNRLKPEDFAAVTVMDVGPAKKAYGEKGRYGATIVETKQAGSENQQGQGDRVYDVCEQLPQFPGGDVKLMEFISRNIKYPEIATENDVQGRVIVRFIVEKDGSLTNPEVLATSPGIGEAIPIEVTSYKTEKERQDAEDHNAGVQALRDEAIRVVKAMPKWIPGKQNGKVVRCKYSIPVTYRLN
ncbi:MAG: energy transducer TonB [Prevotella sp.]|nr:energy transducer TonB [Prevotella sp.]